MFLLHAPNTPQNYVPKCSDCYPNTGSGCKSIFINGNLARVMLASYKINGNKTHMGTFDYEICNKLHMRISHMHVYINTKHFLHKQFIFHRLYISIIIVNLFILTVDYNFARTHTVTIKNNHARSRDSGVCIQMKVWVGATNLCLYNTMACLGMAKRLWAGGIQVLCITLFHFVSLS